MRSIESLLSGPLRTLPANHTSAGARGRMIAEHVQGLAVVDDRNRLLGIVTATDLLANPDRDVDLADCMTTEVLTVSPHTSVVDAARTMHAHGIHHLVVTGHADEVVGVLSAFDLLAVIAPDEAESAAPPQRSEHRASVGDIIVVRGKAIDQRTRRGLITEVRGADGQPPFLVRWFDDPHAEPHDVLFFPGPDADIEAPTPAGP
jgi:signal-transduction protein with cAMP-binding, CBS, and nucleotidyltransferase domain